MNRPDATPPRISPGIQWSFAIPPRHSPTLRRSYDAIPWGHACSGEPIDDVKHQSRMFYIPRD